MATKFNTTLPSRSLPGNLPSSTTKEAEDFIKGAAVHSSPKEARREAPAYPWLAEDIDEQPGGTIYARMPASIVQRLDYMSKHTDINKRKLVEKALAKFLDDYFTRNGIPF